MISCTLSLWCSVEVGAMAVGRVTVEERRYDMIPCSNYQAISAKVGVNNSIAMTRCI